MLKKSHDDVMVEYFLDQSQTRNANRQVPATSPFDFPTIYFRTFILCKPCNHS